MQDDRLPALDGVRGVAILLVLVSHFGKGAFPNYRPFFSFTKTYPAGGGIVGVQLFFVLSGYLITSLLVGERVRAGRIRLGAFYLRRIRRLYPALVALCVVFAVVVELYHSGQYIPGARGSILSALTYTTDLPSFFGSNNGWLGHTWTLAVEEQFYLVWPIVLILTMRRGKGPVVAASVGIAVNYTVSGWIWATHPGWSYYVVTDLRWDALLAGCLLGLQQWRVPRAFFYAGLATLLAFTVWVPTNVPPWIFAALTVACVMFVAGARDVAWLSNRLLVHVGIISYSLYLWHVLVLRLGLPGIVSLVASVAVSEASFWIIERPLRRRLFPRASEPHVLAAEAAVEETPRRQGATPESATDARGSP